MISVNDLFRGIVERASQRYGKHIEFQFGDWDYISNVLQVMSTSVTTMGKRYPIVCLRSPYTELRGGKTREVRLELLIAVNTLKDYTNEQRENTSFEEVLRPVYTLLMEEINRCEHVKAPYQGGVRHEYIENYRYGRKGVEDGDGKPFRDFIDAIEIHNLSLTIKDIDCYGKV